MRTAKTTVQDDQARHLSESLMAQLAKGREWATPGVEAALQRAVAGLDSGIESASPRIQAASAGCDELAGGVETLTRGSTESLKRVSPKAAPIIADPRPAENGLRASRKAGLIAGVLAAAVAGAAAWRSLRTPEDEPVPPAIVQSPDGGDPESGPAAAEART